MAEINKKLVKYATEAKFEEHLTGLADKINPKSVVFIENTGRIWTHGKYYDGAWAGISGKPTTFAPSAHTHSNFNRTVSGFVPAPGLATTTRYLREDGS